MRTSKDWTDAMILLKSLIAGGTGLLMYTGAGCFSPTIIEDDGDQVTLKYGPWATAGEVQSKADAMCAAYDREALLHTDVPDDFEDNFRRATFDCVPPEAPIT